LKGDTYTDLYTAFAADELRATHLPVLCSVPPSSQFYQKTGNSAAPVFIPICAGAAPAWLFKWARTEPIEKKQLKEYSYEEHEHGRHVYRTVEVCNDVSWIETVREWKRLSSIVCVTRKGEREGRQTEETAYYISSREWEADEVAKYIQGHWTIENNLHWSLDTAFNEDSSKIHLGYSAENLSVIRKIAQKLLKAETTFKGGSIRRKAKRVALLNDYAEKVLMLGDQL